MSDNQPQQKSVNFISGLALGTILAAGTTFLYQTKSGKKIRKQLTRHLEDAQTFLANQVKEIQQKAKKIENSFDLQPQTKSNQTRKIKPSTKKPVSAVKKKVFLKSGKPLG